MKRLTQAREDGFTLVELLVAVVILGIVGAVFASTVIQATKVDQRTRDRADAQESATLAMERVTKEIRVAAPLVSVSATSLVIDVYPTQPTSGSLRHRHTFTMAGTTLTQQVQVFSPATATVASSSSSRPLASGLDLSASSFTARDRNGAVTTQASKVASVDVKLRAGNGANKPFDISTTVFLRNYQG